jgi:hypothetical protein
MPKGHATVIATDRRHRHGCVSTNYNSPSSSIAEQEFGSIFPMRLNYSDYYGDVATAPQRKPVRAAS